MNRRAFHCGIDVAINVIEQRLLNHTLLAIPPMSGIAFFFFFFGQSMLLRNPSRAFRKCFYILGRVPLQTCPAVSLSSLVKVLMVRTTSILAHGIAVGSFGQPEQPDLQPYFDAYAPIPSSNNRGLDGIFKARLLCGASYLLERNSV